MEDYDNPLWQAKRNEILQRDNYTCQNHNCNTFDPSMGFVSIKNSIDRNVEFHTYSYYDSIYQISSLKTGLTIDINFGWGVWIEMPILQVHHKRYITNKKLWEYEDKDLITLCKKCHSLLHHTEPINYYDEEDNLIKYRISDVNDFSSIRSHGFEPWTLIERRGSKYSICKEVHPSVSALVFDKEFETKEEAYKQICEMASSFFKHYLSYYPHLGSNSKTHALQTQKQALLYYVQRRRSLR